jgi:NAD dependent epimerase/dehydratase family enzyme
VLPTPAFVLKAGFGEMAQLLLTGQRVLPAHALAEGFVFRFPTLTDALDDLLRD